ncbi:hypothetical protein OG905_36220 [Streptomyces sp. NBC_00322]|nr:hypothetical protein [Streptomyces sp. NBC_00322]
MKRNHSDGKTRLTVLVALAANLVIVAAKAVGGLAAGSPLAVSEAAHSVADSTNCSPRAARCCVPCTRCARRTGRETWPEADHVFLDITEAPGD